MLTRKQWSVRDKQLVKRASRKGLPDCFSESLQNEKDETASVLLFGTGVFSQPILSGNMHNYFLDDLLVLNFDHAISKRTFEEQ
jgi:hypothetical protein